MHPFVAIQHRTSLFRAFFLLATLIFIIYSNTFDAAWHLDDFANITENPSIQIKSLDWDSLAKPIISGLKEGRLDRPLARLSFSLNWFFGKDSPAGYHLVNVLIHLASAWLLYLAMASLFRSPGLRSTPSEDARFICLLGAVLWAVNPIQTQAVTYVVQRMASMAALFSILGVYAYAQGRLSGSIAQRRAWWGFCGLAFILGVATKENAFVLPLTLVVVEVVFFLDLRSQQARRRFAIATVSVGFSLIAVGAILFMRGDPLSVLNYDGRFFSPWERLLTQSRVLVFYLSQIFYPAPTRLSIEHDIAISTSLLEPWVTLPSVITILLLIGCACLQWRRRPLISFAILFFFVNHLIESSIIGLELIFEHRNYLPSMFLFFPVTAGLRRGLNYYQQRSSIMKRVLPGFIALVAVGFGSGTFVRNQVWSSGRLLWEDAAAKAPMSSRPLHNLAWSYYERIGDHQSALRLYHEALKRSKTNISQEAVILNNIASLHYSTGNYVRALDFWRHALESYPDYPAVLQRLTLACIHLDDFDAASGYADRLLARHPSHAATLNLKGIIALKQGRATESISIFGQALRSNPSQAAATMNLGSAYLIAGNPQKARFFLQSAASRFPDVKIGLLWLALLEIQTGNSAKAHFYFDQLLNSVKLADLIEWVSHAAGSSLYRDSILLPERNSEITSRLTAYLNQRIGGSASPAVAEADGRPAGQGIADSLISWQSP
jgi:tetratricopeptide (TPR) repeat protein